MPIPQFASAKKNTTLPTVMDITAADLHAHLSDVVVIDVRQADEWVGELKHIKTAQHIPLGQFSDHVETLVENQDSHRAYVFVCKVGGRSVRAADFAQTCGLKNVFNLAGGMLAWSPQYPETLE